MELCPDDMVSTEENFTELFDILVIDNKILINSTTTLRNLEYAIYDLSGRKISHSPLVDMSIDISGFQSEAIYTLLLSDGSRICTHKFFYLKN